jgi:hypothetical protein
MTSWPPKILIWLELIKRLTVVHVKEKLRDSAASVSGNKEELINRLCLLS